MTAPRISASTDSLLKSADKHAEEAECAGKLDLLVESNALRRAAKTKQADLTELDKEIASKKEELQQ